jgi:N-acetylglucosaminyldiphosphoundecaprenol N-acetyl-beta-D-mannosaminyltransferase
MKLAGSFDLSVPSSRSVLGVRIDCTSYGDAVERIVRWAREGEPRAVCAASVNNIVIAQDDPAYHEVMNAVDIVTADGVPLVWCLRMLGLPSASRVYGPRLMELVCERAAVERIPIGLYGGSSPAVLTQLCDALTGRWPTLQIAYAWSPPFRPLSEEQHSRVARDIHDAGVRILFVGIGTPKQDYWIARSKDSVHAVMLAVGAAFDFLSGAKRQAPAFVQRLALEWLFLLLMEPRRLWKRYLYGNPKFVALFLRQLARAKWYGWRGQVGSSWRN